MKDTHSRFKELSERYLSHGKFTIERVLDVYYAYVKLENQDDLYLTKYALPSFELLKPNNFLTDSDWYKKNSIRLSGSSCTYKVRTKTINGRSKDVVIKWNRMGEEIPDRDEESESLIGAKFNSPFEEFSLVIEMRDSKYEPGGSIITQKPLAIYVPSEHVELWRSGRKEYIMRDKIDAHAEVDLDMFRSYVTVYEWVKGIDAAHAYRETIISEEEMVRLTLRAEEELKNKGFAVRDRKPHHVIVRPKKEGTLSTGKGGEMLYTVIAGTFCSVFCWMLYCFTLAYRVALVMPSIPAALVFCHPASWGAFAMSSFSAVSSEKSFIPGAAGCWMSS